MVHRQPVLELVLRTKEWGRVGHSPGSEETPAQPSDEEEGTRGAAPLSCPGGLPRVVVVVVCVGGF